MAVYIFSLLKGYKPNGVDYAQGYRAGILRKLSCPAKYVFMDFPDRRDIDFYRKTGIYTGQMIGMHSYFTGNHSFELSVKAEDKLQELKKRLRITKTEYTENEIELYVDGRITAAILLDEEDKSFCYGVHYYSRLKLVRTEIYTGALLCANSYVTAHSSQGPYAKLARRTFYDRSGAVCFDQIFEDRKEWYIFPDGRCISKQQLIILFIRKLNLSKQDLVLVDRPSSFDYVQPLLQYGNGARIISVVHSGHYYEKGEDPYNLYLNSEYYSWFRYSDKLDAMIVSTQEQKTELIKKLQEYNCHVPEIKVIPAGGIDRLRSPETKRKPYSLLTVSRIDRRKKIDWMIKSVIKAHQKNPEIFLDIYGGDEYGFLSELQAMVAEAQAQSYIRFQGWADVTEIYKNYEVYITASLWETLGLSVMEAIGSGNAVIGLDVRYGNRLFVHPGENGYLVDFDLAYVMGDDTELVEAMSEKIVDIFSDKDRLNQFHETSYEIGRCFFKTEIEKKWKELLEDAIP